MLCGHEAICIKILFVLQNSLLMFSGQCWFIKGVHIQITVIMYLFKLLSYFTVWLLYMRYIDFNAVYYSDSAPHAAFANLLLFSVG